MTAESIAGASWPPLPSPRAPAGCLWPGGSGREILARVPWEAVERRDELVGRSGLDDGSGSSDLVLLRAGAWCLKTSPRRAFADLDVARERLLATARRKIALGSLLLPETVLAVATEPDAVGGWLWTVSPWVDTLRRRMGDAVAGGDEPALALALVGFAQAVAASLALVAERALRLDVHPSNFALRHGTIVYLDDEVSDGSTIPAIGYAIRRRAEEYAAFPRALDAYAEALIEQLGSRLTAAQRAALDLDANLLDAPGREEAGALLVRRLVAALRPRRRVRA